MNDVMIVRITHEGNYRVGFHCVECDAIIYGWEGDTGYCKECGTEQDAPYVSE